MIGSQHEPTFSSIGRFSLPATSLSSRFGAKLGVKSLVLSDAI